MDVESGRFSGSSFPKLTTASDIHLPTVLLTSNSQGSLQTIVTLVGEFSEMGEKIECRMIVNMPAQIGTRAFDGSIPIVNEVLREANAIPVWILAIVWH